MSQIQSKKQNLCKSLRLRLTGQVQASDFLIRIRFRLILVMGRRLDFAAQTIRHSCNQNQDKKKRNPL
jgi:hypothetical protein